IPEVRAIARLEMSPGELGQFTLMGSSGFFTTGWDQPSHGDYGPRGARSFSSSGPWATGANPAALTPDNQRAHANLARDPSFRAPITLTPHPSCRAIPDSSSMDPESPGSKVTTADVLEELHRATGIPIIADFYTRLHPIDSVSLKNIPLLEALNQVADAMGLRWRQEGAAAAECTRCGETRAWLQFRSVSF